MLLNNKLTKSLQKMEGSHSGRVRTLGKRVWLKGYRGFESPSLRQLPVGIWLRPYSLAKST